MALVSNSKTRAKEIVTRAQLRERITALILEADDATLAEVAEELIVKEVAKIGSGDEFTIRDYLEMEHIRK